MDMVPVPVRDRWIDDGQPIELWSDDGTSALRLNVVAAAEGSSLAVMDVRRIGRGAASSSAALFLDLATGDLRHEILPAGVFDAPLDRAWLNAKLEGELRAALRQRLERRPRAVDKYDWKDGDRPRVSLGDRATFAQLLPAAWDFVTTFGGRRYALIDSYRITANADEKPMAIEIVDLGTGETVGNAEIHVDPDPSRLSRRLWRCSGPIADPLLMAIRQDADRWYELVDRAETVARIARVMAHWDRDLRDPAATVRQLLADGDDDEVVADRLRSLGARCVPALQAALIDRDPEAALTAARTLAAMGDAAGLEQLVAALADPDCDEDEGNEAWRTVDAIASLGEGAVEPLLGALASVSDRSAQDRLLDALTAIDVDDVRVRDLLIELVRAEPGRAALLGDYGQADPAVVEVLAELARERLVTLDVDVADPDAFADAAELVGALRELGAERPEIEQFAAIVERRREARLTALRALRAAAPAAPSSQPLAQPMAPARAAQRPGRNDPCWCGSQQKYKKCHLDSDDEARRS